MPRAAPYPAALLGLIQSTSYPPLPNLEELELLRQALTDHRSHKRKRDDDGKERAVVENNEKAGRTFDAAERHRVGSVSGSGSGAKASPGPGVTKVKKERSGECTSTASPPSTRASQRRLADLASNSVPRCIYSIDELVQAWLTAHHICRGQEEEEASFGFR